MPTIRQRQILGGFNVYGLDLFSGIGGLTKALEGYVIPVAYCEIDSYCRGVLLSRMSTGDLPVAPICHNVTELSGAVLPHIDIIYGGFPCQDISLAGRRRGMEGERSGLFREIVRLAQELKPKFIFLENVPNIRTTGLSYVVKQLADCGYDCRWLSLSAEEIGAPHKRERWFLLAHANRQSEPRLSGGETQELTCIRADDKFQGGNNWWKNEPELGRMANGIPNYLDRCRALGNAVVPAQAREAFERLSGLKQG